ncbi:MAG: hypothetical protein JOZ49_10195, partial [Mycolicibacterium sp.]|nr:hypothetical protein [Mycolicibacterium sp.]
MTSGEQPEAEHAAFAPNAAGNPAESVEQPALDDAEPATEDTPPLPWPALQPPAPPPPAAPPAWRPSISEVGYIRIDDVDKTPRRPPTRGARRLLYNASRGKINPGPSAAEKHR